MNGSFIIINVAPGDTAPITTVEVIEDTEEVPSVLGLDVLQDVVGGDIGIVTADHLAPGVHFVINADGTDVLNPAASVLAAPVTGGQTITGTVLLLATSPAGDNVPLDADQFERTLDAVIRAFGITVATGLTTSPNAIVVGGPIDPNGPIGPVMRV